MGSNFKRKSSYRYSIPKMQKFLQVGSLSKVNLKHSSANTSYGSSWILLLEQNLTYCQGQRPKSEYPYVCLYHTQWYR